MELVITANPTPECYLISVTGEVDISNASKPVSYTHLTLPTTPYV